MAQSKVLISLPPELLREADTFAQERGLKRSELIRAALKQYLEREHRMELRAEMQRGYLEMARINRYLAEEALPLDGEALEVYEQSLRSVSRND
ncbi:MAG: CopG family ribbon-helix-helix protein [Candidatus Fimadaptatus sp.]